MAKYLKVSNLLEQRLRHGDYLLKDFPTDRQLSAEFEVDTRTARKAVAQLIKTGLLVRQPNGRPAAAATIATGGRQKDGKTRTDGKPKEKGTRHTGLHVALLTVAYPSPYTWRWQQALSRVVEKREGLFRPVSYVHLDDPAVTATLESFDVIFFGLPGCDPSDHLLRTIERSRGSAIFLDSDQSKHGFPSVWLASPQMTEKLLEHMAEQGHERIACLNTQPHNDVTDLRIKVWRNWAGDQRGGVLIDQPVAMGGSPMEKAYQVTLETLDGGGFQADGLLCCTSAAAKGVYRALHERGLEAGRDLAVCASDDGAGEAPYLVPSLTSIQDPDPTPYLDVCLDWVQNGARDWKGPLLVQPPRVPLFIGESSQRLRQPSS
ncbi:substrate-binding domain-containing protein [Phycisphaerales bacterium AB-hyl4]|uniref:Substrate-binding domain-containing protein n=1 Tax=Natronomicrosphaera hydrolytica TaxID=3242702 RepID=A0ABV4U4R3_9BACT